MLESRRIACWAASAESLSTVGGRIIGQQRRKYQEVAMAKPGRHGKEWTPSEDHRLRELAAGNTPTRVIGLKLERTEDAVRGHAGEQGVSLKPTNQSPYNRRK
jgi:hypothetical protein